MTIKLLLRNLRRTKMSKELKALKWARRYEWANPKLKEKLDTIETALKRLKTVEEENKLLKENNANLDDTYFDTWYACERLKENSDYALMFAHGNYYLVNTKDNKFDAIDSYKIKNYGIIDNGTQKKLKALEIIKNKRVDVRYLFQCKSLRDYNYIYKGTNQSELCLSKEEYNLLKEVLL